MKQVRMASAEAGFYTLFGAEELGGGGQDELTLVHVQEELNRVCGPSRQLIHENVIPSVFTNGLSPILLELKPDVRDRYVADIASGEKTLCFGLSEAGAGSDVQRIRTSAVRDGDSWVINGSKQWISNAPYADYCILFAVTDPEANRARKGGITAFFVDTSSEGFECSSVIPILGHTGSRIGIITVEDLRVPDDHIIGTLHQGLALALLGISKGRLSMSSMCIGLARWTCRSTTPGRGRPSTPPSPSTRPSRSSWPRWRWTSTPPSPPSPAPPGWCRPSSARSRRPRSSRPCAPRCSGGSPTRRCRCTAPWA
jgi:acyl-CoA dehydrogenase